MPLLCFDADRAHLLGPGPFIARPAVDGDEAWPYWYVARADDPRRNVLTFPGCGGAVLTSRDVATAIARQNNAPLD